MSRQLTAADARQSLVGHVEAKGFEARAKYGPELGWDGLQRVLADRTLVRYPCEICYGTEGLLPGECAHPQAQGERPEDGYKMWVNPAFAADPAATVAVVLYQLVVVNYGDFASAEEAETFGAAALGISRDDYYEILCRLADQIGEGDAGGAMDGGAGPGCCGGGCGGS